MDGMNHQGRRGTASVWTVGCRAVVRADAEESGKEVEVTGQDRPRQGQIWGAATKSSDIGAQPGGHCFEMESHSVATANLKLTLWPRLACGNPPASASYEL